MKFLLPIALVVLPAGVPLCVQGGDLVVTTVTKVDATQDSPASSSTEVRWIGTDRMRVEEGEKVTIVRADLKKMYVIDGEARSYCTIELPIDWKKYIAEDSKLMQLATAPSKGSVTPTTETRRIRNWNATRFRLTMPSIFSDDIRTHEIWATKEVELDLAAYRSMLEAFLSIDPYGGRAMATEMKKIEGLPVHTERKVTGSKWKAVDRVMSIERKDVPAGQYDVPAGFTEKAFDPLAEMKKKVAEALGKVRLPEVGDPKSKAPGNKR